MGMAGYTVALMMIGVIISPCVYGKEFSDHKEIEIERLLKRLNKPALLSIKSEDGDIIDCVPIHSQPAFDHPLLKNHTIQMRPSFIPESTSTYTKKKINATQAWNKNGRCPKNTVPIRRIKKEDILRSKSIENFGKKMITPAPGILLYGSSSVHEDLTSDPSDGHEYAVMGAMNGLYFGTQFLVNIWKPVVQVPGEFSLAQTWLSSGDRTHLNTIEAGLQVYPGKYGDSNVRLFVYWTADGYQSTGCYNTDCSGFVQRSSLVTVGGAYTTVSEYGGNQYELSMLIWKDGGNWWLRIGEELVGYWPGELFNSIGSGATTLQWGGEIVNLETGGQHTATDMGSGHFAGEGFRRAGYFRNLMTVDGFNTLREPQGLSPIITNANCYNIQAGAAGTTWGVNFFYGGPGRNARCP
ncbi:hypothetical protein Rs2_32037 [Raphanus sativus]|uniref:Uncharacterized protein LOC130496301 n=1 Tax=Raphanus sativus TaxID=3726 RepID=A0A9W3BYA0_RAPSA|nr:uncharacterized protein LOC130496301 [Raphanus sativus]XP_056844258.1 uncharacterized protein LOC130496301 [Raphanus sativus]KAJ4892289.1 hypothetical protein Rs2_32037 [Raphanus sativus]